MKDGYIIVTGATRGIGAAIAKELAAGGARVAGLTALGRDGGRRRLRVRRHGRGRHRQGRRRRWRRAGRSWASSTTPACTRSTRATDMSAADFERVMHTNATSVVVASREVYPHLKQAGGGLIVNIGSFFDKMGVSRSVAYCASKAAIGAITRCLAVEWAADNIRVVDVAPGYIATDLNAEYPREGQRQGLDQAAHPGRPAGRPGRGGAAGRLAVHDPTSASSPARPSTSTAARACFIEDDCRPLQQESPPPRGGVGVGNRIHGFPHPSLPQDEGTLGAHDMKIFEQLERRRHWTRGGAGHPRRRAARGRRGDRAERRGLRQDRRVSLATTSRQINALGLNAMFVPEAYGGSPARYTAVSRRGEDHVGSLRLDRHHLGHQLPRHEAADRLRHARSRSSACCRASPRAASASLAITEPEAGSDATGMRTRFTPDGDDIVVDGGKTFITNGDVADLLLVFGKWSEIDDAKAAISALVLEKGTPGLLGRCAPRTRWACAPPPPRRSPSTTAACRAPTCWASRATA